MRTASACIGAISAILITAILITPQAAAGNDAKKVNALDETGATPLMWAAQRHDAATAAQLLQAGADPNVHGNDNLGPLQIALAVRASDIAKMLLEHGANPNATRESGETVLMTAARTGQLEAMKLLIAGGADVNARESRFHQTALMWSAGHPEQVRLLIAHGADIHARTKSWEVKNIIYTHLTHEGTPWHHDGEYVSSKGGQNALFFAVQRDDAESVKALLEAGIDANAPAADGSNALLMAVYKWNPGGKRYARACDLEPRTLSFAPHPPSANMLLDRGAAVRIADAAGYTPLHGAALSLVPRARLNKCRIPAIEIDQAKTLQDVPVDRQTGLALVKRMLELDADPNAVTRFPTPGPVGYVRLNPARVGSSPVHIAAESANAELMKLLLEHGGDANLIRSDGHSPLSLAVQVDDLSMVKVLVANGADVTRTYDPTDPVIEEFNGSQATQLENPRRDQTLLHIAAVAGSHEVIPFLVKAGAPVDLKNDKGETPLMLAKVQEQVRYALNKKEAAAMRATQIPNIRDPDTITVQTRTSDAINTLLTNRTAANQ